MARWFVLVLHAFLVLQFYIEHVECHGRILEPPGRGTEFRKFGGNAGWVADYNDMALFCGGAQVQWKGQPGPNNPNFGKCGACGDGYTARHKPHEDVNGKFVEKPGVGGTYPMGSKLDIIVQLTAAHKGWFEFRLCDLKHPDGTRVSSRTEVKVTQECFDENLLSEYDNSYKKRFPILDLGSGGAEKYYVSVRLPEGISCDNCVLQWWYKTANNPYKGECEELCKQETFVNCADIKITADGHAGNSPSGNSGNNPTGNGNLGNNPTGSGNSGNNPTGSGDYGNNNNNGGWNSPQETPAPKPWTPKPAPKPRTPKPAPKKKPKKKPKKNKPKKKPKKNKPKKNKPKKNKPKKNKPKKKPKKKPESEEVAEDGILCGPYVCFDFTDVYSPYYPVAKNTLSYCCNNCAAGHCPPSHCNCKLYG